MIRLQITTDVKADRRVVLTLPQEVPTGQTELIVLIENSATETKAPANQEAATKKREERNGRNKRRYPLRGSVIRYEQPCDPVAEADWEALG
jgi:hypothetical protein